ncbi:hypothetical protein BDP27DRAFT_1517463 [Rhodocollybia butyracea]|uniref:Uncharacterized protein n=1 Tax=Rhodocollybia butyracea TaxID=206335 RepID=A0A9P5P5Z3_9AGAR|nr:hypothetical protein BDP27DRAFT_1517463 [Rhodocollybia butyracea]
MSMVSNQIQARLANLLDCTNEASAVEQCLAQLLGCSLHKVQTYLTREQSCDIVHLSMAMTELTSTRIREIGRTFYLIKWVLGCFTSQSDLMKNTLKDLYDDLKKLHSKIFREEVDPELLRPPYDDQTCAQPGTPQKLGKKKKKPQRVGRKLVSRKEKNPARRAGVKTMASHLDKDFTTGSEVHSPSRSVLFHSNDVSFGPEVNSASHCWPHFLFPASSPFVKDSFFNAQPYNGTSLLPGPSVSYTTWYTPDSEVERIPSYSNRAYSNHSHHNGYQSVSSPLVAEGSSSRWSSQFVVPYELQNIVWPKFLERDFDMGRELDKFLEQNRDILEDRG